MKKSESTSSWTFRRRFLTVVILTGFLCSLNGGLSWSAGAAAYSRSSESLAMHSAAASIRNYALTNAPKPRTENDLANPKPVKQRAQPGTLPESFSKQNGQTGRCSLDGEGVLIHTSCACSQTQGRAPPHSA